MLECAYTNTVVVNLIFIGARNYNGFVVNMDLLCSVSEASWSILAWNCQGFVVDMDFLCSLGSFQQGITMVSL